MENAKQSQRGWECGFGLGRSGTCPTENYVQNQFWSMFILLRGKAKPIELKMRFRAGQVGNLPHGKITFKANFRQWFILLHAKQSQSYLKTHFRPGQVGNLPHDQQKPQPKRRLPPAVTGETACPTKKRATKSRSCNAENYVQSQFWDDELRHTSAQAGLSEK
jgi:hypothetical protein